MELGRHGKRDRVDASEDVPIVGRGTGSAGSGHLRRPRLVDVDDRYELHARQRGQNAGVMAAEVPDADDGYSQRHRSLSTLLNHEDTKGTKNLVRIVFRGLRDFVVCRL